MKHATAPFLAAAALAGACALAADPATEKSAMPESQTPAVVYFTRDISPEGLVNAYKALGHPLEGRKVAVKISTGEAGNNHYLKPALIGSLVQALQGDIVECNTAYGGSRQETPKHRQTIADHGFNDIAKVVIMDEFADFAVVPGYAFPSNAEEPLKKIFVVEDMPAWCPNLRNKSVIRTSDTRYFTDPSIAVAALGAGPDDCPVSCLKP